MIQSSDRELSDHLQVTVRKNREIRAELEVAKTQIAQLHAEKQQILEKLALDKTALETLLRDTATAKDSLQVSFKSMIAERQDMQARLARLEQENASLKRQKEYNLYGLDPALIKGNLDDVQAINDALKESLKAMRAKTSPQ